MCDMLLIDYPGVINVVCFLAKIRVNAQNVLPLRLHFHKVLEIRLNHNVEHKDDQDIDDEEKDYDAEGH